MSKIEWQPQAAAVFCVVFVTLGGLVALGKLGPEALLSLLAYLAPAPYRAKAELSPSTSTEVH